MKLTTVPFLKIRSYFVLITIGWTILILGLLWANLAQQRKFILDIARAEARVNIEKDLVYRRWNTNHGGVYVPVTEETQPNPYLDVPEREITTPSGRLLTLINPAYMTRQVHDAGGEQYGIRAHLTSLKPLNPGNAADVWERDALQSFEEGVTEASSLEIMDDKEYMRMMFPFITEEGCLRCHAKQGYQVGDVRGGLSVSIPMTKYAEAERTSLISQITGYGILWLLGVISIFVISHNLKKRIMEREQAAQKMQESQQQLLLSEARWQFALEGSGDGVWDWNAQTNEVFYSRQWKAMLGYEEHEIGKTLDEWGKRVHPDDKEHALAEMNKHFSGESPIYSSEHRLMCRDGSYKWILDRGKIISRTIDGKPLRVIGTHSDISERIQANDAVRESERRERERSAELQTIMNTVPAAVSIAHDRMCQVITGNHTLYELLHMPPQSNTSLTAEISIRPTHFKILINGVEPSPDKLPLQVSAASGTEIREIEEDIVFSDGRVVHILGNVVPLFDEQGQPRGCVAAFVDITNRKQAEKALLASETKFSNVFQFSPAIITLAELESGNFLEVNQKFLDIFGFTKEEVIGRTSTECGVINEDVREQLIQILLTTGRFKDFEVSLYKKDGTEIICLYNGELIELDGKPCILSLAQDITEQKRSAEQLRESEASLKFSQQVAHVGHWIWDTQANKVTWSDEMYRIFGLDPENFEGDLNQIIANAIHPDDQGKVNASNQAVITEQRPAPMEYRVIWQDQSVHTVWAIPAGRITDENGNILKLRGIVQDITERKKAEETLRQSQERYRLITENANDVIWVLDVESNKFKYVSPSVKNLRGYAVEEVLSLPASESLTPASLEKVNELLVERTHQFLAGAPASISFLDEIDQPHKNGTIVNTEVTTTYILGEQGRVEIIGVSRDITERKKADEKLHQLSLAVEQNPASVVITDLNGKIEYANPKFTQITGYTLEEAIGNNPRILKSGETSQDEYTKLWQNINSGKVWHGEFHNLKKNGELFWEDAMIAPLTDKAGRITHFVAVKEDITERKRSEKEVIEKNADLAALFSISAHLRTAPNAREMLPVVLQEMAKVLNADANAVILFEDNQQEFVYALGDGLLASNTGLRFPTANSISGIVMQTRKAYISSDYSTDPNRATLIKGYEDIGSAALVPLQSEAEFIGVLFCARRKDSPSGEFSVSEVQLLSSIGEMVGNALRRARLYDDALFRMQRVQALHAIDIAITTNMDLKMTLNILLNQTLTLMDVDAADILTYNPHTLMLDFAIGQGFRTKAVERTQVHVGDGVAGRVALERKPTHITDLSFENTDLRTQALKDEGIRSMFVAPMIIKGHLLGVLELYCRRPNTPDEEWMEFLEALATQAAIAIDNSQLYNDLQRSNLELTMAYDATIEGWSLALDLKDKETEKHTKRVTEWTMQLAKLAGLNSAELVHIRRGALLHDIGKMGIPDRILKKTGKLSPKEWDIMRQHTTYAYDMLYPIEFLRPAMDIPYCHHEKWDGTGYPRGLTNTQIPYAARLFAIIDVWDAITSNRPYRKSWSSQKAIDHIKSQSGKHFDPEVVNLFMEMIDDLN